VTFHSIRALCLLAAVAAPGCGHDESKPERAAHEWVASLRARDWEGACDALLRAPRNCPADLASQYDGRTLALLPPGAYASGDAVTDNRTRFALRATGEHRQAITYFVVRASREGQRIAPLVSVEGVSSR